MSATIFLVEDNPTTRKLVHFALEQKGYKVVEASTGKLALEAVGDVVPDLVLQDLVLPDVDGFELVGRLRERLAAQRVPILAFTGFLSKLDEARISAAGFDDIVVKPIEPSRLLQVIQTYLPSDTASRAERFGAGRRLVVADDNPTQLKLAAFRLARAGFEVVTAPDGLSALERARAEVPAAIVADIMMPRMDGFSVCLEAKRDERLRHVPVILVTSSYVDDADRKLAMEAGATACVLRTPDFQGVVAALGAALEGPAADPPTSTLTGVELEREHTRRIIQQLERQVAMNSGISQRCALLAAELSILTGISTTLSRGGDLEASLDDVLMPFFDAVGVSIGALILFDSGQARVRSFGIPVTCSESELATFFGDLDEARSLLRDGKPLTLPRAGGGLERATGALQKAGIRSSIVVPVALGTELLGFLLLSSSPTAMANDERATFVLGVAAQIAQAVGLARSFASQRAAEREAREKAAMLEAVMESIPDGVAVTDERGRVLLWNRGADEIIRLSSTDLELAEWPEHYGLYASDRRTPFPAADLPLVRAMRGESGHAVEAFLRNANTAEGAWISFTARPLVQDGRPCGGVAVFRDVTKEKVAREQLMVSDRMASVGMLAAGVAHEINNPLAAALANLECALDDVTDLRAEIGPSRRLDELRECLQDTRNAADAVRQIVKDLKIFSRSEEDRRGPVDTRRVMESTLRMAWTEIRHRARLVKSYGDVPLVDANESRLGQVFLNLVVNAAQALPEGRADDNEIHVRTSTDERGRVVIEIRDTGSGMNEETLKRLFTPFFTTKAVGVGTGLGLAICHRIVSDLGGEILVESQLGAGSTFRVILPAASGTETVESSVRPVSIASRRGRVLVIDDDPMITTVVRRLLAAEHEITVHANAKDALSSIVAGRRFDVILCDMMMPVVSGMEFYERLRDQARDQAERIVFVTGGAFTVQAREFLDSVPNARLEKPFNAQSLRALVSERIR